VSLPALVSQYPRSHPSLDILHLTAGAIPLSYSSINKMSLAASQRHLFSPKQHPYSNLQSSAVCLTAPASLIGWITSYPPFFHLSLSCFIPPWVSGTACGRLPSLVDALFETTKASLARPLHYLNPYQRRHHFTKRAIAHFKAMLIRHNNNLFLSLLCRAHK
jgi:hypothetical protein